MSPAAVRCSKLSPDGNLVVVGQKQGRLPTKSQGRMSGIMFATAVVRTDKSKQTSTRHM